MTEQMQVHSEQNRDLVEINETTNNTEVAIARLERLERRHPRNSSIRASLSLLRQAKGRISGILEELLE